MGPSRGDTICGEVVIEALGPMHFGALALGPIHIARTPSEPKLWLSTVERTLLPRSADISRFMAGVGELARVALPGAVPLVLVDREADFCVVGYRAIEGAQTLAQLIERGPDEAAAVSMAGALARTLAEFHRRGFVHGLVTASTVLRAAGTWWTWQYGIAGMCAPDRLAPRLRPPGGDPVAPELRAGAGVSPAADVFGWGAAMACLLTGAIGSEAISALLDDEREDPLRNLVRTCLETVPELRPRDGATLLTKLQAALSGAPASSPSESSTEISFADLNDGLEDIEDGSRFGLPGDPPSLAGTKRAPPPPVAGSSAAQAAAGDPSVVELVVLGPDDGLDDEPVSPTGTTAAHEQELARVRAVHGDAAWRGLAEQYLSEHPPSDEEVDALPVQELVVPSPMAGEAKRGALGRVALIRTRVRTGPQKPVRPDINGCAGNFEMSDTPEREPPPPRAAADARELPLGGDDDEDWDDPDAAVFDLDAPAGPERVDVDEEAVDMEWPLDDPPVDPRGETWPADVHPPTPNPRFVKLGADEDTPAHPTPLSWLENNDEPLPAAVPVGHADALPPAATKSSTARAPASRPPSGELELELPSTRGPGLVLDRASTPSAPPPPRASPAAAPAKPARTASPEPPPKRVGKPEPSASTSQPRAPTPVVVGAVVPATSSMVRPVVTPLSPASLAPERTRRARSGNALAVAFAAATGAIALVATLGLARHRGGIAQLLGVVAGADEPSRPVEASLHDVEPTPAVVPAPPPKPKVCPDDMRPIDGSTCIDRGEFPGLSEIPRTQVDHAEATQACEGRGARLCSTQEWRRACKGPSNLRHPYGARAELDRCNGASASGAIQDLSRSGARDACVTESGVFDLEGNVAEWVSEAAALGGDSATRSPSCDTRVKPSAQTRAAALGFRCCLSLDTQSAPGA